jgi:DNA adenine methylase
LLSRGVISRATLVERDPLIYAFWKCVKTQPEELCERVRRLSVSLHTWKRFQKYLAANALREHPLLDLGVAGLFFNRTNFSGIIAAKPIGGMSQQSDYKINCRFNKARITGMIEEIAKVSDAMDVYYGDAISFLMRRREKIAKEHSLVYIDPPYIQQGRKLYRYHFVEKQHKELAEFVNPAAFKWIISYDNHPFVRALFSGQRIVPIFLNYAVKKSRKAEELLIANIPLIPPVYQASDGTLYEPKIEATA